MCLGSNHGLLPCPKRTCPKTPLGCPTILTGSFSITRSSNSLNSSWMTQFLMLSEKEKHRHLQEEAYFPHMYLPSHSFSPLLAVISTACPSVVSCRILVGEVYWSVSLEYLKADCFNFCSSFGMACLPAEFSVVWWKQCTKHLVQLVCWLFLLMLLLRRAK